MFSYQAGVGCIQDLSTWKKVCSADRSSGTGMDGKTQKEQRKAMQVESSTPALFFHSGLRPGAQNMNKDTLSRNPAMALLQEKGEDM